ncbi:glutathione S-transferase N-terminal domain-containing protein, partial [Acinetobacter baumannii]|uniref:glutathione S-transferase N-terminal domain-containing protein n=1 Tax=Acinetobacter baumannii TaxID=470 RepID=UPI00294B112B
MPQQPNYILQVRSYTDPDQADARRAETLKCIHPLGKAPILTDDEQVIAESAVILEYLQQRYDQKQQ